MNRFVHLLMLLAAWSIHLQGSTALALVVAAATAFNYAHARQRPQV